MFKNIALATALTLGVATAASASTYDLAEFNNFGVKTQIPPSVASNNIEWENFGKDNASSSYRLIEWNGFARQTKTPTMITSKVIDWGNISGFTARS